MNDWELILTMIGEKATTDITIAKNSQGFKECKTSAKEGGYSKKYEKGNRRKNKETNNLKRKLSPFNQKKKKKLIS